MPVGGIRSRNLPIATFETPAVATRRPRRPLRLLIAATALALVVVVGGLVATRGGGDAPERAPNVPIAAQLVRGATLDPTSALTGAAKQIDELQQTVRLRPSDARAWATLGIAYLQKARETNDPSYYGRADGTFAKALSIEPRQFDAWLGRGVLELSRHHFALALAIGQRALGFAHGFDGSALAIIGDAQIELGRYRQAFATIQRLNATKPSLVAYTRESYALELQGQLPAATRLMQLAVDAGSGTPENTQWTRVQLGNLLVKQGQLSQAEQQFRHALALLPGYARAEAGLGAVAIGRGDLATAERWYADAANRLPLPEIVIALGDVRTARGETAAAQRAYALVRVEERLFQAAGGNVDLELAVFDANHPGTGGGSVAATVARARLAVAERPSVYGHDALGWALFKAGDCPAALEQARLAGRIHTADPLLSWHLGAIAACAGDRGLARTALARALQRNPRFNALDAPAAARLYASLGGKP